MWHATGFIGTVRATQNLTRLVRCTTSLDATLERDTGQATGFHQIGSLAT
jgi:hypothetical protein